MFPGLQKVKRNSKVVIWNLPIDNGYTKNKSFRRFVELHYVIHINLKKLDIIFVKDIVYYINTLSISAIFVPTKNSSRQAHSVPKTTNERSSFYSYHSPAPFYDLSERIETSEGLFYSHRWWYPAPRLPSTTRTRRRGWLRRRSTFVFIKTNGLLSLLFRVYLVTVLFVVYCLWFSSCGVCRGWYFFIDLRCVKII